MFNSTIKTVLATTFLVSAFTIGSAHADGGGGGFTKDDPTLSIATAHNPDGSSITARSRRNNDGYYVIKRNKNGVVTSKRLVQKKKKKVKVKKPKQQPFITLHNPDGSSRTVTISNGQRVVITHDANGNQTSWTQVQ